jgi:transcriptional regulator with XRE-family HTH domain
MLEPDQQSEQRITLAETLRELRLAAGLSGQRLAIRCAMSQAKISRIETGKVLPSVVDVEQIIRALSVPAEVAEQLLSLARVANVDYTSWRAYARIGLWRGQVELKKLHESVDVDLAVLPQSAEVLASPLNVFVVYGDRLVAVELFSGGVMLRDPCDVEYHRELFDFFLASSLRGDAATDFLRSVSEEFAQELR